ncbi:ChbG/HpnK family deacetylase [Candidatus Woesebacteria bacterium]|nr:ChbG/HpnK family deacetylase [Candidatus Woesebacteria bacterium]
MFKKIKTSYIFPVYNEEKNLTIKIEVFIKTLKQSKIPINEIILVENGSLDNSWEEICNLEKKYSFIKKRRISFSSYGQAIKHGLLSSNCAYLFVLDLDFHDTNFIKKSLIKLKTKNIVCALKSENNNDYRPFFEIAIAKLIELFSYRFFELKGTDGHKIMAFKNTKRLKKILLETITKHELFDNELLLKLKNEIIEIPTSIQELKPKSYSSLKRISGILIDFMRLFAFKKLQPDVSKKIVADDYGMSKIINNAILDQATAGSITHVSIFANLVSINDLQMLKKVINESNIIAHINILRGKPILKPKIIPSLVDRNGIFFSLPVFLIKLLFKRISKKEIAKEIEAQILFFKQNNIAIKEINSEQHLHAFEPVRSIFNEVAEKNGIKKVRSLNSIRNYLKPKIHKYLIHFIISEILKLIYKQKKVEKSKSLDFIVHPGSNFD